MLIMKLGNLAGIFLAGAIPIISAQHSAANSLENRVNRNQAVSFVQSKEKEIINFDLYFSELCKRIKGMESDSISYMSIGEAIAPDINKLLSRYGIESESMGPLSFAYPFTMGDGFVFKFWRAGFGQGGGHIKFFRDDSAALQYKSIASIPNKTYFLRLKQVKANPRPLDDLLDNLAPDTGLRYFEMTDFDAAYNAIRDITSQEDQKKRAENPANNPNAFQEPRIFPVLPDKIPSDKIDGKNKCAI